MTNDTLKNSLACQYFFCFSIETPFNLQEIVFPEAIKIIRNKDSAVTAIEISVYGKESEARGAAEKKQKKYLRYYRFTITKK